MSSTLIRPGTNVLVSAAEARGLDATRTDTAFMPVITRRGPVGEAVEITAVSDLELVGGRDGYPLPYDCVEVLLRLGVSRVVLSRVVGPGAATATVQLLSGATPTIGIEAASAGEWGNDLDVAVVAGSSGGLVTYVVRLADVEVQRFIDQASVAAAVAAMADSQWVRGVDLAGPGQPDVVAATNLAGGLADEAGITLTEVGAALDAMDGDLGRGQVLAPGWSSIAATELLLEHAQDTNRVALVGSARSDVFNDTVASTWAALVEGVEEVLVTGPEGSIDVSRLGGFFPQWAAVVPYAGGIDRAVPWTVVEAGLIARSDRAGEGINVQPVESAGRVPSAVITAAIPALSDVQRTALFDDRVNVAHFSRSYGLRSMGFQSLSADGRWRQFNWSRYAMSLAARLDQRAKQQQGGAEGRVTPATIQTFGSILSAELLADYEAGELFGATPAEAYTVDVGSTVNTADTITAGEKRATTEVAMTPSGETIVINLIKRPITV